MQEEEEQMTFYIKSLKQFYFVHFNHKYFITLAILIFCSSRLIAYRILIMQPQKQAKIKRVLFIMHHLRLICVSIFDQIVNTLYKLLLWYSHFNFSLRKTSM